MSDKSTALAQVESLATARPWRVKREGGRLFITDGIRILATVESLLDGINNDVREAEQVFNAELILTAVNAYDSTKAKIEALTAAFIAYVSDEVKEDEPKVIGLCETCGFPVYENRGELWHYAKMGLATRALVCARAALIESQPEENSR